MKILYCQGDFTTTNAQMIIHQVNCKGAMNSGAAKCIREKFPIVFNEYQKLWGQSISDTALLGKAQIIKINETQYVVNIFGQLEYGYDGKKYTLYDALDMAFKYLADYIKKHQEVKVIAFPFMFGCGRGGANWEVVLAMIKTIFEDLDITIEFWKFTE